jgi:hypothetical protein
MKQTPDISDVRKFRAFLDAHGYDSATLTQRMGRARPPAAGEEQQMFDDSSEITAANVLIRLFLLGVPVDKATAKEFIPSSVLKFCDQVGLLETTGDIVNGSIVIVPVEDLLFASDAFRMLGTERASEFVLPASTHSANFLRLLTMRDAVETSLDLGCGCGIHALFAARHSTTVVATDISPSAIWYTRFNAMLNDIDNIECLEGSLFEPVVELKFDLIVTNPPFVISPSESFVYRDNKMELDSFCRALLGEAPSYLTRGGHLQMLCEWVEITGQSWQERITGWIRNCDAWILHTPPLSPASYVQQRSSDISGDAVDTGSPDTWLAYFKERDVHAVHPGMFTLRRRDGQNWLHIQNLTADVVSEAGGVIADGIAAVDFLEACDDESLLLATLGLADGVGAERLEADGETTGVYLKLNNALAVDAEIDGAVAAFLNFFSGEQSVQQCIDQFGAKTDADMGALTSDLLAIIRMFVSRGFLITVNVK